MSNQIEQYPNISKLVTAETAQYQRVLDYISTHTPDNTISGSLSQLIDFPPNKTFCNVNTNLSRYVLTRHVLSDKIFCFELQTRFLKCNVGTSNRHIIISEFDLGADFSHFCHIVDSTHYTYKSPIEESDFNKRLIHRSFTNNPYIMYCRFNRGFNQVFESTPQPQDRLNYYDENGKEVIFVHYGSRKYSIYSGNSSLSDQLVENWLAKNDAVFDTPPIAIEMTRYKDSAKDFKRLYLGFNKSCKK